MNDALLTDRLTARCRVTGAALVCAAAVAALAGCNSDAATARNGSPNPTHRAVTTNDGATNVQTPDPSHATDQRGTDGNQSGKGPATNDERPRETTFDDIKFDIQPGEPFQRTMIGSDIESLSGRTIRIRGYILPTAQKRGIKQFVLVRDNMECCFGPKAALYDCILVEMQPGKTAEFSIRPVAVKGRFAIRPFGPEENPLAIYHLEAESVR